MAAMPCGFNSRSVHKNNEIKDAVFIDYIFVETKGVEKACHKVARRAQACDGVAA